ncbi:MAG TPA: PASTA domain-containing protein [Planctomycetota bacterium]
MSRSFAITTPVNTLELAGKASGEVTLTVTNQTDRALRGTARLVPIDPTRKEWIRVVDGEEERSFAPKGTHQYKVKVDVPQDTPKGAYTFRMDFVSSENPDEDSTPGPAIAVKVAASAPPAPNKFPMWIIPVIAVVVIGIGIGLYFALRGGGEPAAETVDVPDLKGKTVEEAGGALTALGLASRMGEVKDVAGAKPGTVVGQTPAAGEKAPKGSEVEINPQAAPPPPPDEVAVPVVTGKPVDSAKVALYEAGFSIKMGEPKFTGGAPGLVVGQIPAGGTKAQRGGVVELLAEKESIVVPSVLQKMVQDAVVALKHAKLDWEPIEEVNTSVTAGTVLRQAPAPGARAEPESVVKLTVAKAHGRLVLVDLPMLRADLYKLKLDYANVTEVTPNPGNLSSGGSAMVKLSYATQHGAAARIVVTPLTGGKLSPGGSAAAVQTGKEGKGEVSVAIRVFTAGSVKVDELQVQLFGPKGEVLHDVRKAVTLSYHGTFIKKIIR